MANAHEYNYLFISQTNHLGIATDVDATGSASSILLDAF
jgi:hypothetical protein